MLLAPLKFRNVLARHGGPLERLQLHTESRGPKDGSIPCSHAAAFLKPDLFPPDYRRNRLSFNAPDGVGTDASAQVACHMAISEALERWALHHLRASGETDRYGLDLDPSSNGFAAFPGLTSRPARKKARAEAIERHCLLCWWEGLLDHHPVADPAPGVKAIRLDNPFGRHAVTVVWGPHLDRHHTYGFGTGRDTAEACRRSLIERDRSSAIIDIHLEGRRNGPIRDRDLAAIENPFERRILYFSRPQGFRLFCERLGQVPEASKAKATIHFDGEVPGPWSCYATVWRTVIVPPTRRYLSGETDVFFW